MDKLLTIAQDKIQSAVILIVCIILTGVICLFSSCNMVRVPAHAGEIINIETLATAIYYAEGGAKTKFPYGIKSIDTKGNKEYARKICINTIRNNIKRFNNQNKYTDYIEFLGSRFCPTTIPSEYALNRHWVGNVRKIYAGLK